MSPALFFFLKIDLASCGLLWFHLAFRVVFSFSKNPTGILIGIVYTTDLQGNENQSLREVSFHTYYDGHYPKNRRQVLARKWRNWNPCALLVGIKNSTTTVESSVEVPREIKNRTTTSSSSPTTGYLPKRIEIRMLKIY